MRLSYFSATLLAFGNALTIDLTSDYASDSVWPTNEPIYVESGEDVTFKLFEITKLAHW